MKPKPCKTCGTCPTCGNPTPPYEFRYYPPVPQPYTTYPYWQSPDITTSGSTFTITNQTAGFGDDPLPTTTTGFGDFGKGENPYPTCLTSP